MDNATLAPAPFRGVPAQLVAWSSALAAGIAVLVLTGWFLGAPALLRIHPSFVAMQFNTALAFALMAVSILASMRGARRVAIAGGVLVATFSAVAAVQYLGISHVNLDGLMWLVGVDPALRPLTQIKTSAPGRMAPNTALCFLLASAAVISLSVLPRCRRTAHLSSLAGVAIGGIALLALLGYLGGAPSAYGWGGLTRMAVHTAVAMMAVGVGVASLSALRLRALGDTVMHRLPATVGVGGTVVTLGLWLTAADYQADSPLPMIVAFVGLLVTVLLVVSLRMVQAAREHELDHLMALESAKDAEIARERAAELARVNDQLRQQIAERERVEREREAVEQQLSQAQKMEAVGQLAGGVAHDFNNLLTVITSYCELLLEDIPEDDARHADVEEVLRAAGSAARLTRQLLAFSRQQILQPEPLDLNLAVNELEKMLRRLLPADIGLETSLSADLGTVTADRGQLEQVVVNLVVNGRDAMPNGGRLSIATANVDLDDSYIARQAFGSPEPGHYVVLSVSDTGHGMDAETQARIFEPFFTTKEKGRGTGLGLSTVYGIVKQSGGYIWLYSEVGRGTTFKIYLPRVEKATGARLGAPAAREITGGDETVLLVEDEEAVRTIAQRILERHGYRVLAASNGAEAVRVAEGFGEAIDVVVTDLVMPQMGGQQTVLLLRSRRPEIKVLMMSGYTSDHSFRQRVLDEGIPFLEKPFTPGLLLAKVRAVLDAEDAGASLVR